MPDLLKVFFVCLALAEVVVVTAAGTRPPGSIIMKVQNLAGAPIQLYWINTFKPGREEVLQTQTPIRNGTDTTINSYDTHQFLVRFKDTLQSEATVEFEKGPREEVVTITYDADENVMKVVQTTKLDEIKDQIHAVTQTCADTGSGAEFGNCVAAGILDDLTRVSDAKATVVKYRDQMSERLRNYTCADPSMQTTTPLRTDSVRVFGSEYTAESYLDLPSAKIFTVPDFVTPDECNILMEKGRPLLKRATVAADDGTSVVSENRKANQAVYTFAKPMSTDPLWPLYARVFKMLNQYVGFNLAPPGQEEFTIIQYNEDDQYTPHCDGTCDGSLHHKAGRVATAVLYCKTPERGGATTFTKADVFINPKPGMATFFSYKDVNSGHMDDGFTEHSGCPVIDGEKWISTVWMREGVSESNPWGKYDPSGIEILNENQKNLDAELDQISSSKKNSEEMRVSSTADVASTVGVEDTGHVDDGKDSKAKKGGGSMFSGIFGSSSSNDL